MCIFQKKSRGAQGGPPRGSTGFVPLGGVQGGVVLGEHMGGCSPPGGSTGGVGPSKKVKKSSNRVINSIL